MGPRWGEERGWTRSRARTRGPLRGLQVVRALTFLVSAVGNKPAKVAKTVIQQLQGGKGLAFLSLCTTGRSTTHSLL